MDLLKKLNNMITVEELLKTIYNEGSGAGGDSYNEGDIERIMIEFAKLHVEAALKEASENFKMKIKDDVHELDMNDDWMEVDKNSILTAYSLENIK